MWSIGSIGKWEVGWWGGWEGRGLVASSPSVGLHDVRTEHDLAFIRFYDITNALNITVQLNGIDSFRGGEVER